MTTPVCPACGGPVAPAWEGSAYWFRCPACVRVWTRPDLRAADPGPTPADHMRASGSPGLFPEAPP